ncbi:Translin-associated factor X-interacting N-terminus [Lotmaria passim]
MDAPLKLWMKSERRSVLGRKKKLSQHNNSQLFSYRLGKTVSITRAQYVRGWTMLSRQAHSTSVVHHGVPKSRQDAAATVAERGAYHLPPLNPSVSASPSAASPRRASHNDAINLPLTVSSLTAVAATTTSAGHSNLPLVPSKVSVGPVQMWPAVTSTRQRRRQKMLESRSPLSLQLEGFIRREHQQYLREHPSCSRIDTLFIFREALTTFVNHFAEYRGVLCIIRDEYDAALREMTEKAKQMQVEYLESQSDRGLHAMELIQLKESTNATISNQQAQLGVLQGLVHSLRDQLTAAEHANSTLTLEMEQKKKTYVEAQQQVKLLSRAMIEETARTAAERERAQRMEKEAQLQESRVQVLQGNVAELEECLRQQTYLQSDAQETCRHSSRFSELPAQCCSTALRGSAAALAADGSPAVPSVTCAYVAQLLSRIDALEMQVRLLEQDSATAGRAASSSTPRKEGGIIGIGGDGNSCAAAAATTDATAQAPKNLSCGTTSVDALFPVMRQWLRMEGIDEGEVEATDIIVPPGLCMTEDMGFLGAVQPVKHRHLSLGVTLRLVEAMWQARERPTTEKTRLRQFFLEWLRTQVADVAEAKALGVNLLDTCQHNIHHPECHALLLVLRGYLPEEVVHLWRRRLAQLQQPAQVSPTTVLDTMPFEDFFTHVRTVCPEKSIANMRQLRFAVFHHCANADFQVRLSELWQDDSYFSRLFKYQCLQEVEKFTLQVVEGIREVADEKHNTVSLVKMMNVMRGLDPVLSDEEIHTCLSQCCQKPVIDVATADDEVTAHLDVVLLRFRSSVLLRRHSPEDAVVE